MVNAVGYCRFSSINQRDESIEAQKRAIKYYAKEKGYNIIRFYEDRALSGKSIQRPAFLGMIADVKKGGIDAVIVHKLDRFSRNAADSVHYDQVLRDHGVELISVMEAIDNSPSGNLMRIIISAINSFYIDNLAHEVQKGLKENAHNCLTTGGTAPLGYDIVDKKYVINPQEAEAVRIIFSMYDEGYSYNKIIQQLNALGYKTKKGNQFGKNSLYDLLHNERYKGTYVYNKAKRRKRDGSRSRQQKPDSEIIRKPGGIPAIVDEELWARVNKRLEQNKQQSGMYCSKETYLLSGLIFCGECGYAMHGNARFPAPNREKFISYRCNRRDNNLACANKEIKRDNVENFVIAQLEKRLFNDDVIPQLTQDLNAYINKAANEAAGQKDLYENRQKELEKQKQNMIDAIAKTGYQDIFQQKLLEVEQELGIILDKLKRIQSEQSCANITEDMVRSYLGAFKYFVRERDIPQIKKFIDSYVERVDVFQDSVKVTFKVAFSFSEDGGAYYSFDVESNRKGVRSA